MAAATCAVPTCANHVHRRGWCDRHWANWRRNGDPEIDNRARAKFGEALTFFLETVLAYEGDDCLFWPFGSNAGHATIWLEGKTRLVHVLLCEREHGPRPTPEHEASHSCGRGHLGCVNRHHMHWATHAENQGDRVRHGTSNRGERCSRSKLTESQVQMIRSLGGSLSQREIGARFGIQQPAVSKILNGCEWGWLGLDRMQPGERRSTGG